MSQPVMQKGFQSGEWAPQLYSRVDIDKYHSGAALLRNFFVDYRGGASTRTGTKYILQAYKSSTAVRLIPFQASFDVGYILEFGDHYLRFYNNEAPVLEAPLSIAGVSNANPCVVTVASQQVNTASPINSGVSASYAPGEIITLAGGTFTAAAQLEVTATELLSAAVNYPGSPVIGSNYKGYSAGDVLTLSGGTVVSAPTVQVLTSQVCAIAIHTGGSGGTPGPATITGSSGTGTKFQASVTIGASGNITSINSITLGGAYTVNPTYNSGLQQYLDNVSGASLVGATVVLQMGVGTITVVTNGEFTANPTTLVQTSSTGVGVGATFNNALMGIFSLSIFAGGNYTVAPSNPVSQGSSSGSGLGATFNLTFINGTGFAAGDWIFISGVGGTTQLNGNYYSITSVNGQASSLADLNGNPIDSTAFGVYTGGGTASRVYTLPTQYAAADLALLKFAQNVSELILCHPSYPPSVLTIISSNDWLLQPINFGTTATAPTGLVIGTSLSAGTTYYSYVVTSINSLGDESIASAPAYLNGFADLRVNPGANSIAWLPVPGAVSYNVYKSDISYSGVVPAGVPYGFIGNVTGTQLSDANITPDFGTTPPIGQNPFVGAAVASITQGSAGTYTTVPAVIFSGGSPNATAIAAAILQVQGTPTVGAGGSGYSAGDFITLSNGVVVKVATVSGSAVATLSPIATPGCNPGSITVGSTPTNPVAQISTTGGGTGATINLVWGVGQTQLVNGGAGYLSAPTISYSPTGATATATLSAASNSYPGVPGFFQQRLVLCAAVSGPQTMDFSQPGSYFNFDTSSPIQADDAISVTLASGVLNTIKSLVQTAPGLIVYTDKACFLVNGGSLGSAISPSSIVANQQSGIGASDVPPILNNFDILSVESKGSVVRDSTYNYYAQVYTGQDISVIASHLFFGYQVLEWAWAQEPFKIIWAVRSDGVMLSLTFVKEQEFIAWAHHDTAGSFKSVATVVEPSGSTFIDAVYTVVQRTINGRSVQYIERFADRSLTNGATDAWCVDAGLQYNGSATLSFQGAQQLAAATVTGLATDDQGNVTVITPFVMATSGAFTLPAPSAPATGYTRVTIGLAFTPQLQTLPIDVGEPTIQSKMKKINASTLRVVDTLGLEIGTDFNNLVQMQDLVLGNVGSMTNQVVTGLVTGDARTFLDPLWQTQGQYCVQQNLPYPATITGVIPQLAVGDTAK